MRDKQGKMVITKAQARRFLVNYHGLGSDEPFKGKKGIQQYIEKVGCIQYDPLNVVGTNPDLVLQSRIKGYSPILLDELLYTDRTLIDGWDKMMAIYSTEDWPYFHRIRDKNGESMKKVMSKGGTIQVSDLTEQIKKVIRVDGPKLGS
ncbi:crosslink repair DNA glycosylase YcaQ family protein [Bacillus carboniphilus]|uniref:Crosslink repair DNA glycosylase YcaQ family protein n=1 Tax=Bacillus carboniphilus TaxID=86663 RepID=A0ABY9JWC7_9BACI|nr:crosslink repair DNA glycosylase YcaQ family protein [Bacillus carboniphilus]WLR42573.1 crosslink repair DNA glycosylase YcaQ family protein [Bacillus carboniphilus]